MGNKYLWWAAFLFCFFSFQAHAADPMDRSSPFGVLEFLHWNHAWNNYKYPDEKSIRQAVRLMKEAGIRWVRMDFLWDEIEPSAGKFNFDKYDKIVDVLSKERINILALLDYSAPWAADCGQWNCPPKDPSLFVNYAVRLIEHYKGQIKYWEVWNEPDSSTYWSRQDGLKGYCALLKQVYTAAKIADPGCYILNGGLSSGLSSVNKLYDHGAKNYFDILNLHIFETPMNPRAIDAVTAYPKLAYKIMVRNGDAHKKIWITEIGCPGVKKGQNSKNWWMGQNPSEQRQAAWLNKVYTELLKNQAVEKVFWAFFRDCKGHWGNGVDYFGIVRWDFSRKPAFYSYKKCADAWRKSHTR